MRVNSRPWSTYQLGALDGIARAAGHRMTHMSFHGALGNMAAADAALAKPLVAAVAAFDPKLAIVTSTSRAVEGAAAAAGLRAVVTFLADRAYDDDGLLVPRKVAGSVIHDQAQVLERVRRLLSDGVVITHSGKRLTTAPRASCCTATIPARSAWRRRSGGEVEATGAKIVPLSRHVRHISAPYPSKANPSWRGQAAADSVS